MNQNSVSIIIPTYNESENICNILDELKIQMSDLEFEAIVVDDNSPDGTGKIVDRYIERNNSNKLFSIIHRKQKTGLSSAIIEGLRKCKGELIVVMDSDFSHPPKIIPKMIEKIRKTKCDLVIASRYSEGGMIKGWSMKRKLISKTATIIAKLGLGINSSDPMSGFFLFRKNIIEEVKFDAIGYKILLEILVKTKGVRIEEIPYTFSDRKFGESKLNSKIIYEYCKSVWRLYRYGKKNNKTEKRISVKFLSKAGRFFTVGASGLGINYLVSLLFSSFFDYWYIHATIFGIISSISSNFILNKIWTFEDRDFSLKRIIRQYGLFSGFSSIGAIFQLSMIYLLVDGFSQSYPLALIFAVGLIALLNFILNKKWTFKEKIWS